MEINISKVDKIRITGLQSLPDFRLDPISVWAEDFQPGHGQIVIKCWDKAWCSYWPAMGGRTIKEFFIGCHVDYLAKNLSKVEREVVDEDKFEALCEKHDIDTTSIDEPWKDVSVLTELFGSDWSEWWDLIPKCDSSDYKYLIRVIKAVQAAFKQYFNHKKLSTGSGINMTEQRIQLKEVK